MFKKLRTAVYYAPDIDTARQWYESVLGFEPYFASPFYVGFDVNGTELGLDPNKADTPGGEGGAIVLWEVDDARVALSRLLERGATPRRDVQDMDGVQIATVHDPFGNILGIIQMPTEQAS